MFRGDRLRPGVARKDAKADRCMPELLMIVGMAAAGFAVESRFPREVEAVAREMGSWVGLVFGWCVAKRLKGPTRESQAT